LVNYNGNNVNIKDVKSGYVIRDDTGIFFMEIDEDLWEVIRVADIYNPENIKKINYVISKANTKQINEYFMYLLSREFPDSGTYEDTYSVYQILKSTSGFYDGRQDIGEAYVSEYESVIVDGRRYRVGEAVYKNGQKYEVKSDSNGEGYLELVVEGDGGGFNIEGGQRRVVEEVHNIDYSIQRGYLSPFLSDIYADYNNLKWSSSSGYTVLDFDGIIERRLKASKLSEVRYWERFDFSPGYKTKVVTGKSRTLEEGVLTSQMKVPQQPPTTDYGEWLVYLNLYSFEGRLTGKVGWVKLKESGIFRVEEGQDAIFYRSTVTGFEEVVVKDFWRRGSNYITVNRIYVKHKSYSNDFFNEIKQVFGSTFRSYEWFVNKYKDRGVLMQPKEPAPSNPHTGEGSGTITKFFGRFEVKSSSFDVDVRYSAFLRYEGSNDTMSRGKAKLQLVRYKGDKYEVVDTLLDLNYNVGDFWNPDNGKWIHKKYSNMNVGVYEFLLILEDTFQDTKVIGVRALPKVTEYTTEATKEYDGSYFVFSVIDGATGEFILIDGKESHILSSKEISQGFQVIVPQGREYIVRGQLVRGEVAEGGITGNGGSVRLSGGVIKYDVIQREFPRIVSIGDDIFELIPIPGWDIEPPSHEPSEGDEGDVTEPFCWLDVIQIMEYFDPPITEEERRDLIDAVSCYPKGTKMRVTVENLQEFSDKWFEFCSVNELEKDFEGYIEVTFTNPLDMQVDLTLDFIVDDNETCGGGGFINYFGGGFEYWNEGKFVGDGTEELISEVKVSINEYISESEVIGGCNGSYAEIIIKNKNTVLKTIKIEEEGWTDFSTGNLYDYDADEFDIEIKTYQNGYEDPRGYDVRSIFILNDFNVYTSYELSSANFNSILDFSINDEKKLSLNTTGEGSHYFPVTKGLNRYKFVFSTNNYDYNWDCAEITWVRLTNWICDDITVVPYCEPGGGDKCIEALIGCLLGLLPKKKGCVIIKHVNYNTGEVIKQVRLGGFSRGEHTFHAFDIPDFQVVGDSSKTVFIEESDKCSEVVFYYKRLYRDCVLVIHKDVTTGNVILKEDYPNLVPGEYIFSVRDFDGYEVVGETSKTVVIEYLTLPPEECKVVVFEYRPTDERDGYCVWVVYREKDNPQNVLATDHYYNLEPGEYRYTARDFEGYELVGDSEKYVVIETTDPHLECKIVVFEYRKLKKGCVVVKFIDRVNDVILDTDYYYSLLPSNYSFEAKMFEGFKLVDEEIKTILITEDDEKCKEVIFLYEPLMEGCAIGKKIWLFT